MTARDWAWAILSWGLLACAVLARLRSLRVEAQVAAYRAQLARRLIVRVGLGGEVLPIGIALDVSLASAIALSELGEGAPLVSSFRRGWSVEIGPDDGGVPSNART